MFALWATHRHYPLCYRPPIPLFTISRTHVFPQTPPSLFFAFYGVLRCLLHTLAAPPYCNIPPCKYHTIRIFDKSPLHARISELQYLLSLLTYFMTSSFLTSSLHFISLLFFFFALVMEWITVGHGPDIHCLCIPCNSFDNNESNRVLSFRKSDCDQNFHFEFPAV
jgi:hypothetical protein